ncbi:MAG: NADAR family protein, partial [Simkania sp.]|nr:NADAR family protein [Simkania sp.]
LRSRKYSHEVQAKTRNPGEAEKLAVMDEVATLKFMQNPPLAEALIATYPRSLVENTESAFWGGETNHMGKILERVREMFTPPKS